MNKFSRLLFAIIIIIINPFCSCEQTEKIICETHFDEARIRILAIGNSFTRNATQYLPEILSQTYNTEDILFCDVIKGGSSLEDHWNNYKSDSEEYQMSWTTGRKWNDEGLVNLKSILNYSKWDIVILQQVSGLSGLPESYKPYISQLTSIIRRTCPQAIIGWQMTWSYSTNSTHPDFEKYNNDSEQMLRDIRYTLKEVKPYVDTIIPAGDLINLLRQTKFNTSSDLTVDGYHLMEGLPCFSLSCLWHETLVTPFTGVSCRETTLSDSGTTLLTKEEKEVVNTLLNQL